jgi:transcription antitermination factor NusG
VNALALEDLVTVDGMPGTVSYALRVPPQREFAVERILRDAGFEARVPIKHRLCRPHRKAKRKELRAFAQYSGYVFVMFCAFEAPAWGDLFRFDVVKSVIGENGKPTPIPERAMRRILLGSQRIVPYVQAFRRLRGTKRPPRARHNAEIISGPYEGNEVRITELSGRDVGAIYQLFKGEAREWEK